MKPITQLWRAQTDDLEPRIMESVSKALANGGVVVFPTDTVYGMGASVFRPLAIRRIYKMKGRSWKKPLPFLVSDVEQALSLVEPPDRKLQRLLRTWWPGPLTVVFKTSSLGRWTTGGKETLALRIPKHPVALAILREAGAPLAVTSANRSGQKETLTGEHVARLFFGKADVIVDGGPCQRGVPSTVLDVSSSAWTLVREGAVSREELLKFL